MLRWIAPGDDGYCGTASAYRWTGAPGVAGPRPLVAGTAQTVTIDDPRHRLSALTLQAVDDAGNAGIPCRVVIGGGTTCGLSAARAP